jgi:hypothetical protein
VLYHLSHSASLSLFFMLGVFRIGSHELFAQGQLWTTILMISSE